MSLPTRDTTHVPIWLSSEEIAPLTEAFLKVNTCDADRIMAVELLVAGRIGDGPTIRGPLMEALGELLASLKADGVVDLPDDARRRALLAARKLCEGCVHADSVTVVMINPTSGRPVPEACRAREIRRVRREASKRSPEIPLAVVG